MQFFYKASDDKKILLCLWAFTKRGSTPPPQHRMKSLDVLFSTVTLIKLFLYRKQFQNLLILESAVAIIQLYVFAVLRTL